MDNDNGWCTVSLGQPRESVPGGHLSEDSDESFEEIILPYSITRNNSEGPSQKPRQLSANLQTVGNPLAKEAAAQPMISTDPDSRITQERKFLENMRAQIDERLLELDQLQTSSKIAIGQVERPRTYAQTQSNIQNRGYRTAPIDLQHQISSRSNAQSSSQNAKKKRLSPNKGRPRGETCIRCKLQKLKCVGGAPCEGCQRLRLWAPICVRADFASNRVYIRGLYKARMNDLVSNVACWIPTDKSVASTTIRVSNGFPVTLALKVQQYIPLDMNPLTHILWRGMEVGSTPPQVQSSAFGLIQGTPDERAIDSYLDQMVPHLLESIAKESNPLIGTVLLTAYNAPAEGIRGAQLVQMALRLWSVQTIFFKSQWRIVSGANAVQMAPLNIPGFWNGITLLPRLINQQLDALFEQRMADLEKEILYHLQEAIFKHRRTLQFSIFLTTFLTLHSLEKDTWNLYTWMSEVCRAGGASWPLEHKPILYSEQNTHLANLLNAHYKAICKGSTRQKDFVHNEEYAIRAMQNITELVNKEGERKRLQARTSVDYMREDNNSLDFLFTSKLLLD